jgi:hypothetical protein
MNLYDFCVSDVSFCGNTVNNVQHCHKNFDTSDDTTMIGVLDFDSRRGQGIFLFTTVSRTALGSTQPPIQWVPGALSLGGKAAGA